MTLLASLLLTLVLHEDYPCRYAATYWDLGEEVALADEMGSCDAQYHDFQINDGRWVIIWTSRFAAVFQLPEDAGSGWF